MKIALVFGACFASVPLLLLVALRPWTSGEEACASMEGIALCGVVALNFGADFSVQELVNESMPQ